MAGAVCKKCSALFACVVRVILLPIELWCALVWAHSCDADRPHFLHVSWRCHGSDSVVTPCDPPTISVNGISSPHISSFAGFKKHKSLCSAQALWNIAATLSYGAGLRLRICLQVSPEAWKGQTQSSRVAEQKRNSCTMLQDVARAMTLAILQCFPNDTL
jgi:hypothetical protein